MKNNEEFINFNCYKWHVRLGFSSNLGWNCSMFFCSGRTSFLGHLGTGGVDFNLEMESGLRWVSHTPSKNVYKQKQLMVTIFIAILWKLSFKLIILGYFPEVGVLKCSGRPSAEIRAQFLVRILAARLQRLVRDCGQCRVRSRFPPELRTFSDMDIRLSK